jgi:hypothetical protein
MLALTGSTGTDRYEWETANNERPFAALNQQELGALVGLLEGIPRAIPKRDPHGFNNEPRRLQLEKLIRAAHKKAE